MLTQSYVASWYLERNIVSTELDRNFYESLENLIVSQMRSLKINIYTCDHKHYLVKSQSEQTLTRFLNGGHNNNKNDNVENMMITHPTNNT